MLISKSKKVWLLILAAGLMLFMASCSTKSTDKPPENKMPKVEIVNIPPNNSHFTSNPVIYWFGTDVDGFIVGYEYSVVPAVTLSAEVDTSKPDAIIGWAQSHLKKKQNGFSCSPESCWQIIDAQKTDNPNRQTISLFASEDPNISIEQYFFVRAIDNDSGRSNIDYRLYSRTNHPPDTEIKTVADPQGFFDLPETTSTYKGIFLEWKGTDKLDYPDENNQPPFEYYYQLFGPYEESEIPLDTANHVDLARFDTTDASKIILSSIDTANGSVWVNQTTARVYNLWRNAAPSSISRRSWFVLKVTTRDDAFVSDPTPALGGFNAIDPKFEKNILVYVPDFCVGVGVPGEIWCQPDCKHTGDYDTSDVFSFYRQVFQTAGYGDPQFFRGAFLGGDNYTIPARTELCQYKLIVLLDDGDAPNLSKDLYSALSQYMDLGGDVFAWAIQPFGKITGKVGPGLSPSSLVNTIPHLYFGVLNEYRGGWTATYNKKFSTLFPPFPATNEEFIGGLALPGKGLNDFQIDLEKVKRTYILLDTLTIVGHCLGFNQAGACTLRAKECEWADTLGIIPKNLVHWVGAPSANYYIRDVFTEPLYLFNSYYGDFVPDSLTGTIAGLQGKVLAVRYNTGTFKTAVFGFSLWTMKEDETHHDASDLMRKMLDWFLKE